MNVINAIGEASMTATGLFWKAAWAFVLGYAISAMIQVFVPKKRLTRAMGEAGLKGVGLATVFGAASSSCSFAALAAARSLVAKGAHLIAAVAFMFASTNLVIELGILIVLFLGWEYLFAEIIGGLVLIGISWLLMRLSLPRRWARAARERAEETAPDEPADFDWRKRLGSASGWRMVGNQFVAEWKMVWEEILIGFTIAGFMGVLVPDRFWKALFLYDSDLPAWIVTLENAVVGPFVAALTFIGSMGNIPLATVLASSGVLFAGIMAFIYSDLMVPPLVRVNSKYYGWRFALYVAGIMFLSIVSTALILSSSFAALGLLPEADVRPVREIARFQLDYTFAFNVVFGLVAAALIWLHRGYLKEQEAEAHEHGGAGIGVKRIVVGLFVVVLVGGVLAHLLLAA